MGKALTRVRPERDDVYAFRFPKVVQREQVRVDVVLRLGTKKVSVLSVQVSCMGKPSTCDVCVKQ